VAEILPVLMLATHCQGIQMLVVNCYNCKSAEHSHYISENGFNLVKCTGCGLLYIRERPDDTEITRATATGQHHGEVVLDANVSYNHFVKNQYRAALAGLFKNDFKNIKTWLDVGCGYGEFMETLTEVSNGSITTFGSEPNDVKRTNDIGRGLNVDYFDLATHTKRYDAVSLMNVYSHLPDPNAFIGDMIKVVKPGGYILIQTGDAANFSPEDILRPLCLPDHLSFASEQILRDILAQHGATVEQIHRTSDIPLRPIPVLKEIVKAFMPGRDSYLKYYLKWWKYKGTSLYVLAKVG
jgi:2-polyprenyl-3-methyl-5-hydroxy-6-metoxy-1,4-benzoquinol methylase